MRTVEKFKKEWEAMHKLGTWKTTTDDKKVISISKSKKERLQTRKRNVLRIKDEDGPWPEKMVKQEPRPIVAKGFTGEYQEGGILEQNTFDEDIQDWMTFKTILPGVVHNEARQPARLKQYPLTGTEPTYSFSKRGNGWLGKCTNMQRGQNVSMFSGARYLNWPTA